MRCAVAIFLAAAFTGCTTFTPPAERPIIKHEVGIGWGNNKFETLAATADRRVILVSPELMRACAEPSPDAIVSLASTISATLGAEKEDVAEIKSAIARGFAWNASSIAHRTQGLAFYRDMAFQACQLWINDVIDQRGYMDLLSQAANLAAPLISQEIALIPSISKQAAPTQAAAPEAKAPDAGMEEPAAKPAEQADADG
jgi:hypothetical protein